jgi:Protein of unknown function (DUF2950)
MPRRHLADDRMTAHVQDPTMNKTPKHCVFPAAARLALVAALASAAIGASAADAAKPASDAPVAAAKPAAKPAPKPAPKRASFATPQAGVDALVAALRGHDEAALQRLLGADSKRLIDSGDSAADRAAWDKFVADYDAKHEIQMQGDSKAVLSAGASDWPMPIPLVKRNGAWQFDTATGIEELIARRIGRNELDAMQVCLAFVDMEREYAELDRNGDGTLEYTSRLISTKGQRDGLYWETQPGEPPSPAGPRLAEADPNEIASRTALTPYHGYYYRVLTKQGKNAPGGARDYRVNGKLIGGFALIAWPASYLSSGVKTFACNMDAIVYERDFGPNTAAAVAKVTAYDPGPGWSKAK